MTETILRALIFVVISNLLRFESGIARTQTMVSKLRSIMFEKSSMNTVRKFMDVMNFLFPIY